MIFFFNCDIITEPYVLETIKPVKVPWQEDPRFQDSSSEGDDDDEPEAPENEGDKEMQVIFVFVVCLLVVV